MKNIIGYLFPVLLLVIFVFTMNSSDFIKDEDIDKYIYLLNDRLNNEQWDSVSVYYIKLKNTWEKNVKLIQFSVERSEIRNINTCIARLYGAISARDKSSALIELNNMKELWKKLGN